MTFMNEADSIHFLSEFTLVIFGWFFFFFKHVVVVNIVPAIIFMVYDRGKPSFIWSVKLSLSFEGKQEQMSYKKEKEAKKELTSV